MFKILVPEKYLKEFGAQRSLGRRRDFITAIKINSEIITAYMQTMLDIFNTFMNYCKL